MNQDQPCNLSKDKYIYQMESSKDLQEIYKFSVEKNYYQEKWTASWLNYFLSKEGILLLDNKDLTNESIYFDSKDDAILTMIKMLTKVMSLETKFKHFLMMNIVDNNKFIDYLDSLSLSLNGEKTGLANGVYLKKVSDFAKYYYKD